MNKKGMVLILSFMVIAIFAVLTTALISGSVTERFLNQRHVEDKRAFWLAEAGINRAIYELRNDKDWAGFYPATSTNTEGEYMVTVAPGVNPGEKLITSTGYFPNHVNHRAQYQLELTVSLVSIPYEWAALCRGHIFINSGGKIYGDVGTASGDNGAISLGQSSFIDGNVIVPPTADPALVVTCDQSSWTGPVKRAKEDIVVPLFSILPGLTAPVSNPLWCQAGCSVDAGGNLSINSGTHILAPGDYRFSSVGISQSGKLVTSGPGVSIFVDNALTLSQGGELGNSGVDEEKNLSIKYSGSSDVTMGQTTKIYGSLQAPFSRVVLSSFAQIYGSVIANMLELRTDKCQIFFRNTTLPVIGDTGESNVQLIRWIDTQSPYEAHVDTALLDQGAK